MATVTGIIDQFLHPPFGALHRELMQGVFSGSGSWMRQRGPLGVDAFGVEFDIFTVPADIGTDLLAVRNFEFPIAQLAVVHSLGDGHQLVSQLETYTVDGIPLMFERVFPDKVLYWFAPGVIVTAAWLVVF